MCEAVMLKLICLPLSTRPKVVYNLVSTTVSAVWHCTNLYIIIIIIIIILIYTLGSKDPEG